MTSIPAITTFMEEEKKGLGILIPGCSYQTAMLDVAYELIIQYFNDYSLIYSSVVAI